MFKGINNIIIKGIVMFQSRKGGMGVKEIAASLAAIVVIGIIITAINGRMGKWLDQVWTWVSDFITKNIKA